MSDFLIGPKRPSDIYLGEKSLAQVYFGKELVWEKDPGLWTYFDYGYVNGIKWASNQYGEKASALDKAGTGSYLQLYYDTNIRGSWRTRTTVKVPRKARTLQVVFGMYNKAPRGGFGLIHESVSGTNGNTNTANGGQWSGWNTVSKTTTYSMTLNENLIGSSEYYIVCTALFPGGGRSDLRIYRARFLDADGNYLN